MGQAVTALGKVWGMSPWVTEIVSRLCDVMS